MDEATGGSETYKLDGRLMLANRPFFKFVIAPNFTNWGDYQFFVYLGRYHNSEASSNDNGPRLSTAHRLLFLQSDIMDVKGLLRELPVGGVIRFEQDGQH